MLPVSDHSSLLGRFSGLRRGKQLGGLTPADTACHAVGVWVTVPGMDAWCHTNCLAEPMPSCPEGMCQCGDVNSVPPRPSLQLLQGSLPRRPAQPLPAVSQTGTLPSPPAAADGDTVQALLTELAALRRERLRYQTPGSGSGGAGSLPTSGQLTYLAPGDNPAVTPAPDRATSARGPLRPFYFAPPTTQRTAPLTGPPEPDQVERFPPAAVTGPTQDDLRPVTLRPASLPTPTEGVTEPESELLPTELLEQERNRGRLRRLERLRQELRQQRQREKQQQQSQKQQQRKKQQYQQQMQQKQRQQQQLGQQRQQQKQIGQQQLQQQLQQKQQQQQQQSAGDDDPQWETSVRCTAVVPWRFMSGVTKWCNDNCLGRARPSCPVTICACTNAHVTISNPAVEDGRNRTLMQITHKGNRAKIVLNGVGADAPGGGGGGEGSSANRSTTLYFKARAPGFLFFIQPIDREGGAAARGRPQSARAIVVPMGQKVDRQRARQAAAEVLRRQRTTGRPPAAVTLASASTASPRTLPVRSSRAAAAAAAAAASAAVSAASQQSRRPAAAASLLQLRQQEELYRNIGLLAAAGGRTRNTLTAAGTRGSTEVVPLNPALGLNHDPPGDTAPAPAPASATATGTGTAAAAQRRSDSARKPAASCRGVGKFRHSFAMDYWCEVNCASEKVRNCPKNLCECRGYARLQNV